MFDKNQYLESLVNTDLQKFIITHLDEEPEKLLEMCIEYWEASLHAKN